MRDREGVPNIAKGYDRCLFGKARPEGYCDIKAQAWTKKEEIADDTTQGLVFRVLPPQLSSELFNMNHLKDPGKEFLSALPDDEIEQALEHTATALVSANVDRPTFLAMSDEKLDQLAINGDITEHTLTVAWLYWSIFSAAPIKIRATALPPGMSYLSDMLAHFVELRPLRDVLKLAA